MVSTNIPFSELSEDDQDILCYGSGSQLFITSFHQTQAPKYKFSRPWEGIIERLKRTYTETTSNRTRSKLLACMVDEDCPTCHGEN